jgi:hypothetical protein
MPVRPYVRRIASVSPSVNEFPNVIVKGYLFSPDQKFPGCYGAGNINNMDSNA